MGKPSSHGKQFLVVVDAHSKWLEVVPVPNLTSQTIIDTLRSIFVTHGLPELLVSDNGPSFTSAEFQEFMKRNGIRHITSVPYHPASNGLAERAVQTFKTALKKTMPTDVADNTSQYNWSLPSRVINGSMTSLIPRSHASIHRDPCVIQSGTPKIWT